MLLQSFANLSWFVKSLIGTALFIPFMVGVPLFGKHFSMKPEIYFFAWCLGLSIGYGILGWKTPTVGITGLFEPLLPWIIVLFMGVVFGTTANILLAQAVPIAPNPALPFAVSQIATGATFLIMIFGSAMLPRVFPHTPFVSINFIGMLMILLGAVLVSYRPTT